MSIKPKLLIATAAVYHNNTVTKFNLPPLDLWAFEKALEAYEAAKQPVDIMAGAQAIADAYQKGCGTSELLEVHCAKACAKAWGLTTSQPQKAEPAI